MCLNDPVGPTATDRELECIVVSEETSQGGEYCNKARSSNGLVAMAVYITRLYGVNGDVIEGDAASAHKVGHRYHFPPDLLAHSFACLDELH